jgi:hypothetical protein
MDAIEYFREQALSHLWEAAALALYTGQSRDMEHYAHQGDQ